MIGWGITIDRQQPEDYPLSLAHDSVLADWKVGSGGTSWLDELVDRGEAQRLKTGGYSELYSALAGSIVPLLLATCLQQRTTCLHVCREKSLSSALR